MLAPEDELFYGLAKFKTSPRRLHIGTINQLIYKPRIDGPQAHPSDERVLVMQTGLLSNKAIRRFAELTGCVVREEGARWSPVNMQTLRLTDEVASTKKQIV